MVFVAFPYFSTLFLDCFVAVSSESQLTGFLGAMPANRRSMASAWPTGFRGSQDTDVSFTSFGNIKTLTALGGSAHGEFEFLN